MPAQDSSLKYGLMLAGIPAAQAQEISNRIDAEILSQGANGTAAITGGAINNTTIGVTTPAVGKFSELRTSFTDTTGTPGNATANTARGRSMLAATASQITITNSLCNSTTQVLLTYEGSDATATSIIKGICSGGSFTAFFNAAATANTFLSWTIIN